MFRNCPVVKIGWRAYLVLRNYGGNLDCDQMTCTQVEKCRGCAEEIMRYLDAPNRDFAHRVSADRLTCIFLRAFGKWMTGEPHSMHSILWTTPPPIPHILAADSNSV